MISRLAEAAALLAAGLVRATAVLPAPASPDFCSAAPAVTGVAAVAPPVPVVHWMGPCLSQAGGYGAVSASRLKPEGVKVGLLQLWTLMVCTSAPGILAIWAKLAVTRLMGMGEYPSAAESCWP